MIFRKRDGGRAPSKAVASILGAWLLAGAPAMGQGEPAVPAPKAAKASRFHPARRAPILAAPGYLGFGLGYHPGYGYGGDALGVGAFGGYPLYGGPGYPHPAPCLRRLGGIAPFPYFGGPGYPSPDQPHFFGGVGGLAVDPPGVTFEGDPVDLGYGAYTGTVPHPEGTFAPSTAMPAPAGPAPVASGWAALGIDAEPVAEGGLGRGLKVTKVRAGGRAEGAGLRAGDVIRSTNGYVTEQPGNLSWIIANASPDKVLKLVVRNPKDGEVRTVTARRE